MGTWFDYTDVEKKINAGLAARKDRPDDKMASQDEFTRKIAESPNAPGFTQGFLMGMNSGYGTANKVATLGITPGGVSQLAKFTGMPEEAARKIDYATAELRPGAYLAGSAVGAGLGMLGAARAGGAAALRGIGNMFAPATTGFIGPVVPGVTATAARIAKNNPATTALTAIAGGFGANALGVGQDTTYDKDTTGKRVNVDTSQYIWPSPEAEQQFKLSMAAYNKSLQRGGDGPTMLNRDAAAAGTDSVAAQYWGQIHNADGSLKPGITPAMEARARLAVEYDAKSKAMGDNTRVAVPLDAFPGGEAGARLWQNQYGEASNLAAINGNVPVRLADAISSPQVMSAAQQFAQAQAQAGASDAQRRAPVSFSQVMDMYEEAFPGNVGGPRTPDQRAADVERDYRERVQAREAAIDAQYIGLGKQVGITDPNVAIALGRGGQFTRGFMDTMLGQQQGPPGTPRVPTPKDLEYNRQSQVLLREAAIISQMPEGTQQQREAKQQAQAANSAAWELLSRMVFTSDAPLITPGVPIE